MDARNVPWITTEQLKAVDPLELGPRLPTLRAA